MYVQDLSELIARASIKLYDIIEDDINLTEELTDGRTIKIESTMEGEEMS